MRRELSGKSLWLARTIAVLFSLFHIFAAGYGYIPDMQLRALHILFGLVLTLMFISPWKRGQPESRIPVWDIVLIGLTIATTVNAYWKYVWYYIHIAESTALDLCFGVVIVILAIEAGRRVIGWALPILTLTLILYTFFGNLVPGLFFHKGFSFDHVMQVLYQGSQGVFGFVTGVSAGIIAIFIVFGSLLLVTGGGQTFIDLAIKLTGRIRGGPALVAVVASSLFGTISGTVVANVATTGNFTIPLMKRLGYRPEFAAAVEAAASSGGLITPPIMGAGCFVMAEILQIPYRDVMTAGIIPAVLFYVAVFSAVRFRALRLNLRPIPAEEIPKTRELFTWNRMAPLFVPIGVLLYFIIQGYSPASSAFWACATAITLFLFSDFRLSEWNTRFRLIINAFEHAGVTLIQIVSLVVCANIIVSLINLTGIGVKFSGLVMDAAGTFMPLALLLAAMVTVIMGMGMPATASYLIAISVLGQALTMLGVIPLAAHLFVFYFAVFSAITPPICAGVFAAAAIADADWLKVAFTAVPLAIIGYVIPFVFIYEPALLGMGKLGIEEIIVAMVSTGLGAVFIGASVAGYLNVRLRIDIRVLLILGGLMLLVPDWRLRVAGAAIAGFALAGQMIMVKKGSLMDRGI